MFAIADTTEVACCEHWLPLVGLQPGTEQRGSGGVAHTTAPKKCRLKINE